MKLLHGCKLSIAALMLLTLGACSDETNLSSDASQINQAENSSTCVLMAKDFQWESSKSRSSLTVDGGIAKFSWTPGDRVGILPDVGAQVFFEIPQPTEGDEPLTDEERRKATFDGGAWALKATSDYAAYYPFIKDYDLDREKVPVDYMGQKQTGITTSHLGAYDYLGAHIMTTNASGGVNFSFDHVGALVLLRFNVPEAGTTLKNVTMSTDGVTFTTKGTYDLTVNGTFVITPANEGGTSSSLNVEVDYTTTVDNEEVTVYFMAAPVNLSDKKVDVTVAYGEGEDVLSFEADGKNLLAGYGHLLEAEKPLDIEVDYDTSKAAATLTIEEKDMDIVKAVEKAFTNEFIQYLVVSSTLTESQQTDLAKALKDRDIVLCLPKILKENLIDALNDDTDGITVYCPFSDASKALKGDVALIDGTFVSNDYLWIIEDYLEPAGVVFWTEGESAYGTSTLVGANVADKVMQIDYPDCTHGLIVSLKDVSAEMYWQDNYWEAIYVNFQITDKFNPTLIDKSKYMSIRSSESSSDYINKILGYNNTKILEAYNDYCIEKNREEYLVKPVVELAAFSESNPAPAKTTGWYFPSPKELHMLCFMDISDIANNNGTDYTHTKTKVNQTLKYVEGDSLDGTYWASTESESGESGGAFAVYFNTADVSDRSKTYTCKVRAVCAF